MSRPVARQVASCAAESVTDRSLIVGGGIPNTLTI